MEYFVFIENEARVGPLPLHKAIEAVTQKFCVTMVSRERAKKALEGGLDKINLSYGFKSATITQNPEG